MEGIFWGHVANKTRKCDRIGKRRVHIGDQDANNGHFTIGGKAAGKILKRGKAAEHHEIASEMLSNLGQREMEILTEILTKCSKESNIPKYWEVGIILPLFKIATTASKYCKNYRGITLISTVLKVYEINYIRPENKTNNG